MICQTSDDHLDGMVDGQIVLAPPDPSTRLDEGGGRATTRGGLLS
jgi:hypothetical protein